MRKKILVVGDIMVDRYTYVRTERTCPDAPVPVWDELRTEIRLGGAANVANNLVSLIDGQDVDVYLAGIVGNDMKWKIEETGIKTLFCNVGPSIVKHRYVDVDGTRIIGRFDNFKQFSDEATALFCDTLVAEWRHEKFDAVILSDYRMGTIAARLAEDICRYHECPVYVDSKRKNLSMFSGASLVKLNESEFVDQLSCRDYECVESLFDVCVVTRGPKGAELRTYEQEENRVMTGVIEAKYTIRSIEFPLVQKIDAVDVTGCGDTFMAALVYYVTTKSDDVAMAIKFANFCATQVVQKFGTSVVRV